MTRNSSNFCIITAVGDVSSLFCINKHEQHPHSARQMRGWKDNINVDIWKEDLNRNNFLLIESHVGLF
jgi:hypothetical protein